VEAEAAAGQAEAWAAVAPTGARGRRYRSAPPCSGDTR
jgi:hypothetical protein